MPTSLVVTLDNDSIKSSFDKKIRAMLTPAAFDVAFSGKFASFNVKEIKFIRLFVQIGIKMTILSPSYSKNEKRRRY